jgi:hypothetical protein
VTSGNQEKIEKAVKLGAKGGVIYKDGRDQLNLMSFMFRASFFTSEDWNKKLQELLPKDKPKLDVVIDGEEQIQKVSLQYIDLNHSISGAGGDVARKLLRLLRHGAIIVCYGQ